MNNEEKFIWNNKNKNMILSVLGEKNAEKLMSVSSLKGVEKVYSSNSVRAISTAKYIAEDNNLKVEIENKINERKLGIKYIEDLPVDFVKNQFKNKDLKYKNGESLNEVSKRFDSFVEKILKGKYEKVAIVIHGIALMNYLSEISEVKFDGNSFIGAFNGKKYLNGALKNPDIYEVKYENEKVVSIKRIKI